MKKLIILIMLMLGIGVFYPAFVSAQGMMDNTAGETNTTVSESSGHTSQGEAEGKVIWGKLQAEELDCKELSDDDFHSLGMHFMGVMVGDSHEAMDTMMEQMMGETGENQMHIAMGKRMSGCEEDASIPQTMMGGGMMPMMSMMMGSAFAQGFGGTKGGGNSMTRLSDGQVGFGSIMGYGANSGVYGVLCGLTWIALITFLVAGTYFFIKQAGLPAQAGKK